MMQLTPGINQYEPNGKAHFVPPRSRRMNKLQGKVALIIGDDVEFARSLAIGLAEKGVDIVLVGPSESVIPVKEGVEQFGRRLLWIPPDKRLFAANIIQQIMETFGRLDIFVDYSTPTVKPKQEFLFAHLPLVSAALHEITRR